MPGIDGAVAVQPHSHSFVHGINTSIRVRATNLDACIPYRSDYAYPSPTYVNHGKSPATDIPTRLNSDRVSGILVSFLGRNGMDPWGGTDGCLSSPQRSEHLL